MSSVELPEIVFTDNDYNFDHAKYIKSLVLSPIEHTSNNENIPFESIQSIEQYKSGARMNSFQTDKKRLPFWIRGLTLRYWESLGKCEDFSVQWEDKRKIKLDEIQITLETTTQATRQTKQKLFVIKVHLKIGTITVQGNGFPIFGLKEFPAIKEFVNTCVSRDKQSSVNIQSQSVEESCPKAAVGTECVP